jgi:hypothetical protein
MLLLYVAPGGWFHEFSGGIYETSPGMIRRTRTHGYVGMLTMYC